MKANPTHVHSTHRRWTHARWAGLAYIVVIVAAGFAQGGVRERLIVDGNAADTAANILEHAFLFKFGLASDPGPDPPTPEPADGGQFGIRQGGRAEV